MGVLALLLLLGRRSAPPSSRTGGLRLYLRRGAADEGNPAITTGDVLRRFARTASLRR